MSWFLLYAFRKPLCVLLAMSFLILMAKSGIPAKKKIVSLVAMILAGGALIYWIGIVDHSL